MPTLLPRKIFIGSLAIDEKVFWIGSGILLLIAYLIRLGQYPLDMGTDEPRRALVSLEMMLSGDYITPTLNGEIYLNKPPLYNWLIILMVKAGGAFSMFYFRLPVIISLVVLGLIVYHVTKHFTNSTIGFFTAFAFCSNGRILIYDSLLGLIDTTFALMVYVNFIVIFWFGEKKNYTGLFLISYMLTAIGFLTKGFPMLAFQGITLGTYFFINKNLKALFTARNLLGMAVFFMLTGLYYAIYFGKNNMSPVALFGNLFHESSKRTIIEQGTLKFIDHLAAFPFQFGYHFLPWTIFLIVLFRRSLWQQIKNNKFIYYSACVFLTNIVVYWLSPEVYARYLFMFLPLVFSVCFYLLFNRLTKRWQYKFISAAIIVFCATLLIACIIFPFTHYSDPIEKLAPKVVLLALMLALTLYLALRHRNHRLYAFVLAVIIARVGFNYFVLDQRGQRYIVAEANATKIAELTKGQPLFLQKNATPANFDGMSFHLSNKRESILQVKENVQPGAFYIANPAQVAGRSYTSYFTFATYESDTLLLVKYQ